MISEDELYILSYYRACELAGSVLFGKIALVTDIDKIRVQLTHHCLEEAEHAWLWTETIKNLGRVPVKVLNPYQTEYGKEFGMPRDTLEILCLTQVFENRTLQHFTLHRDMPDVHPLVKRSLQKMIDDEAGHIGWVKEEMDKYSAEHGPARISDLMDKLEEIDNKVYSRLLTQEPFSSYFGKSV